MTAQLPAERGLRATPLPLKHGLGKATVLSVEPSRGANDTGHDMLFVDPYTGGLLGSRR